MKIEMLWIMIPYQLTKVYWLL